MRLYYDRTRIRNIIGFIRVVRVVRGRIEIALGMVFLVGVDDLFGWGVEGLVVVVSDEGRLANRWRGDALTASSSRTHTVAIISITICATAPRGLDEGQYLKSGEVGQRETTYDAKSEEGVKLDQTMKPTKEDRNWIEDDI